MSDNNKNIIVSVRLSAEQQEKIKSAADEMGVSLGTYVRVAALYMARTYNEQ